ncbi:MAG: beta-ketoacyl synthase N-terminal-like domain-containing protein, partial [Myxococcota bacterium]
MAVVGVGALFPGAPDAATFWDNIAAGRDAITDATPRRLDPRYVDAASSAVDRVYTRRGGFVGDDVAFDAGAFGIMPVVVPGTEPDQLLALQVAAACLADAGIGERELGGRTVGVILGRGGYLTPGMVRLGRSAHGAEELAGILRRVVPGLDPADIARVKAAYTEAAGPFGPDTAIGLVPNLAASRIANRLDLDGPAYTVDAACASSLVAVEHGVRELRDGRCDLVLAGGVHLVDDMAFWSVFAQIGALSRSGSIRPFDRRADGLLVGEGVGMVALKRLSDAERDGDRIYAVIWGTGVASDGRASSVMVPRVGGQVRALRRAWADAGIDPAELGLIEAHGTATPAGDAAELATLREVFGVDGPEVALGSVKSMIGHAMPAAGAAGLIKAVLAVHHGVLPPSLHCDEPAEALAGTRFRVRGESHPWDLPAGASRTAAVNAFGFGGINAHVVVRSHGAAVRATRAGQASRAANPVDRADAPVLAIAGRDPAEILARLDAGETGVLPMGGGDGPCRLAVVDPTPDRIARARRIVERGEAWTGRGGTWFRARGLADDGGRIAFVFPGIEVAFAPEVRSIADRLGVEAPTLPAPGADLQAVGHGVVDLGRFLNRTLRGLGVAPAVYAGHSIGEWTGMIASGIIAEHQVATFLANIPFSTLDVPDVLFAAAGCGLGAAREAIDGLDGIAVSHDNCPHQVILCGRSEPIEVARARLVSRGVLCQVLPFKSGFHSPLFADYVAPHRQNVETLQLHRAATPLWSATTVAPYPDDPDAIRGLILDHLVEPLRFRALIEALYAEGVRIFVQVGTGSVPGFVSDTLGDRPHLAISASEDKRSGLAQLRNLALALYVDGAPIDLAGPAGALVQPPAPTAGRAPG